MLKKVVVVAAVCSALGCTSAQAQDLALNRPATASSTERGRSEFRPTNANDGNSSTRWSSEHVDNQWWQVDLGSDQSINRVELDWEVAYAREYRIRTRTTTRDSWSTAARGRISSAGLKTHTFATRRARYVRIQGDVRATRWGISLWDLRVCNISCSGPVPPPPRDADGDGVPDSSDQCPNEAGPASNNGCPIPPPPNDTDGDGVPDSQDQCPNQPGPASNNGCPAPSSGEPAPIAGQGYRKVFADEFDTFDRGVWSNAHWLPAPPADSIWIENGVLNMASRRSQGFPDVSVTTRGTSYLGPNNRVFRHGYFETRVKWTKGQGSWPAFWMLSNDAQWGRYCPPTHAEIDIFEPQGSQPTIHHLAMHTNSWGDCIQNTLWQRNVDTGIDTTTDYHTYSAVWTPDRVRFYFDDRLVAERALDGAFANVNQDMNLHIKSACGGWTGGCTASSPNVILTQFDWVRVWQR